MAIPIGLIGAGAVATYGHLPAIAATPDLDLAAVFDPSPDALERVRERFGNVAGFTDAASFFASGIEAVTVTSPAPCHRENVLDAAGHKLPVLCEKPLAMDAAESAEMVEAMEAADRPLFVGFTYRFSPVAADIYDLVRSGEIGEVRSLRLIYNWNLHGKYATDDTGNQILQPRREGRMAEGGPMVDCGTHQIDLARWWLGSEVRSFQGLGAWVDDYEAPDHMWVHMDHANGAHTMVEMSYAYCHTAREPRKEFVYELIGTEGVIRYDREPRVFEVRTAAGTRSLEWHHEKGFEAMYAEWARALRSGRSDRLATGRDGLAVGRIAREATEEAMRNRDATIASK